MNFTRKKIIRWNSEVHKIEEVYEKIVRSLWEYCKKFVKGSWEVCRRKLRGAKDVHKNFIRKKIIRWNWEVHKIVRSLRGVFKKKLWSLLSIIEELKTILLEVCIAYKKTVRRNGEVHKMWMKFIRSSL
jgi:hypothetical protein